METELDKVSNNSCDNWYDVLRMCLSDIDRLSKPVTNMKKETFTLDDSHVLMFSPYGPSIKHTDADGNKTYFKTKMSNIDMDKLREGAYTVEDLIEEEHPSLGEYDGHPIQVKKGKFGSYLEYGGTNVSIREWKKPVSELDLDTAIEFIEKSIESQQNMLDTNIFHVIAFTKLMLPQLRKRNKPAALIVNSSAAYSKMSPNASVYSATKAFTTFFTKGLAKELEDSNIDV